MSLAELWPRCPNRPSPQVIREAYNKGVTFFDTASLRPYASETIVGGALERVRDEVKSRRSLASLTGVWPQCGLGTSRVAEGCLKRLRTDRIDLFYQHRVDPNVPIEDVAGAVHDLIKEGRLTSDFPSRARPRCAAPTPCSR